MSEIIEPPEEEDAELRMRAISRRSFVFAGMAVCAGVVVFRWMDHQPDKDGIIAPLRVGLRFDDAITSALYSSSRLSKTYSDKDITEARTNGGYGLGAGFDPASWHLNVDGLVGAPLQLTLADIQALPREEFITEFKCIEGWSFFMRWAGARFIDFHAKYPTRGTPNYVAFETPAAPGQKPEYYVSIDMPGALHPQTLLCYEMNGKPLALEHGAPLRLIIPHKYGVKNLKRIGTIRYQESEPADYWAEQGYDSYAGL